MIYKFSLIERLLLKFNVIPHTFFDVAINPGQARALSLAVKLGITDSLAKGPMSIAQLSKACGISEKGCRITIDCLDAIGYLDRNGDSISLNKRGMKFLAPDSPHSYRYFVLFCHWLYESFARLEGSIINGEPDEVYHANYTQEDWEIYSRAMMEIARGNLPEMMKKVKLKAGAKRMMDLGGSHGLYTIGICEKYPEMKATILDVEEVRKYADEYISQHQMGDRIEFQAGNFLEDELPGGMDLALLMNIIHIFSPEVNQQLFQRVAAKLEPGGQLIIFDQIKGIGGKSQMIRGMTSFMALNLFHQTGGNTYTFEEVREWASKAGFSSSKLAKLRVPGFGLITCTK